ncbi:hypothetical protein C1646_773272 [Rhizophagus diaphanus]|nr:hypothetical protein C1646_773272 [Rhizophagus diaphanus] [Rhizophagus sp. MUCL 43196]
MPQYMEMRLRQANLANLDAFFTDFQTLTIQPQKDSQAEHDFIVRLAKDLDYLGVTTDLSVLGPHIYDELGKRLGRKTAHVRRSPFSELQVRNTNATKKAVRKAGHTKVNCPKGKQTKKVNHVYQDEVEDPKTSEEEYIVEEEVDSEEEEIEDDDEYDDDIDEESQNCYKGVTKKSSTSKSRAENTKVSSNIAMATDLMYQIALKSSISSLVPYCSREILIEISKVINMIFPKLKDHCLNIVMPNDTVKRRELVWENVASKFQDILFPLLQAINTEQKPLLDVVKNPCEAPHNLVPSPSQTNNIMEIEPLPDNNHSGGGHTLNHAIKAYAQCRSAEKKIDADDVATIYCKIGGLVIPCAMIDTGSDSSIFSDNIAELVEELLGIKINRKKIHRLNGVASQSLSIGTMENVPITIGTGENTATITDEFSVVSAEKDQNGNAKSLVILGI